MLRSAVIVGCLDSGCVRGFRPSVRFHFGRPDETGRDDRSREEADGETDADMQTEDQHSRNNRDSSSVPILDVANVEDRRLDRATGMHCTESEYK
jgi:hypothetical protein